MAANKRFLFLLSTGLLTSLVLFFLTTAPVLAAKKIGDFGTFLEDAREPTGIEDTNLSDNLGQTIQLVLQSVGIVLFILMVLFGFYYFSDNEEYVKRAKDGLTASVIGLVIIVGAYGASAFLTDALFSDAPIAPDVAADAPIGCCQDRISDGGVLMDDVWACRRTTEADCRGVGETCEPGDDFCGAGDWNWTPGEWTAEACAAQCEGDAIIR